MGINFRGQASRFKTETSKRNQAGFQEKSAAGPRQGVGGDQPGKLAKAERRFNQRRDSNNVSSPITQRAKPSPLKINNTLVTGAADVGKKFVDVGEEVGKAFAPTVQPPVDLGKPGEEETGEIVGTTTTEDTKEKGKTEDKCPKGQHKDASGNCVPTITKTT